MRTNTLRLAAAVVGMAFVIALGLTGCGSQSKDTTSPTATVGTSGAQLEVGNTINYTLAVKGTCASVNVGGADNKITFDKVDKELSVVGINNTITYKDGDPKVDNLGSGNKITKG
jgi:hypothetical protein